MPGLIPHKRPGSGGRVNTNVRIASLAIALLVPSFVSSPQQVDQPAATPSQVLVLGFMGGRNKADDARYGVARFAKRLRDMDLPCVRVEAIENTKRDQAMDIVRRTFNGRNHTANEPAAHLIIYGQSFGGAAVVKFARQLQADGIPVILTVQIDAVGVDDSVIPANVAAAANMFQSNGTLIHGTKEIRAENPKATRILGNFRFDYSHSAINISDLPLHKRLFQESHARMDRDPAVWNKVEELILVALADNGWCRP